MLADARYTRPVGGPRATLIWQLRGCRLPQVLERGELGCRQRALARGRRGGSSASLRTLSNPQHLKEQSQGAGSICAALWATVGPCLHCFLPAR